MFKFLSPSNIFKFVDWMINSLQSVFFIILIIGLTFALIISPHDYLQSESVRIMYVHVPAAWLSLGIFALMTILSLVNYIFKLKNLKIINKCMAPIGLLFSAVAVITGSVWGKPTWGAWWVWDARLTSMLFLMFLYIVFIISFKYVKKDDLSLKIISIVSLVGAINLFVIKYSVDWWNTLHQPASITLKGDISVHSSMLIPLFLMLFVFIIYSALIFLMKYKTEIIKVKKKNLNRL